MGYGLGLKLAKLSYWHYPRNIPDIATNIEYYRNGNFEQDRLEQLTTARWREIASTRAEINSINAAQTIEEVINYIPHCSKIMHQ